jgi:formylglycine-generating enzyme required for sulfatase activity
MSEDISQRESAGRKIVSFGRKYGKEHLILACHAAFPIALTPDLLYQIRAELVSEAPWVGVAHVLLSPLCHEVSYEMFEMELDIRNLLLEELRAQEGKDYFHSLANFMLSYIKEKLLGRNLDADLEERYELAALSYIKPNEVARELAQKLSSGVKENDVREAFHWTPLTNTLALPLKEAGYEPLLTYNNLLLYYAQGNEKKLPSLVSQFRQEQPELENRLGLKLSLPLELEQVLPDPPKPPEREEDNLFRGETVYVNTLGEIVRRENIQVRYFDEPLGEGVEPLRMMYIPPGQYWMGSESDKDGYHNEKPQHLVTVRAFYMSQTLITQAQWQAVAALPQEAIELDPNCAGFKGNSLPVEKVSWREALEFCARISRYTGRNYRLPSEGEWEYACRAIVNPEALGEKGKKKPVYPPFHFGETLTGKLANYDATRAYQEEEAGEYREKTTRVRTFPPNAFGLYDMHGNVLEWCLDPWHRSYEGAPEDSRVWDKENNENHYQNILNNIDVLVKDKRTHVLRGGSWIDNPRDCRSAYRCVTGNRGWRDDDDVGFRLVCPPQDS